MQMYLTEINKKYVNACVNKKYVNITSRKFALIL